MTAQGWHEIGLWCDWMKAGGAPDTTIVLRRDYVRRLARAYPHQAPSEVTLDDLTAWLSAQSWSPATRKSARSALRCFFGWLRDTGRTSVSPAHLLPAVRMPRSRPRPTPETAYRAALASADDRERLAIMLAGRCGLRLGEIARAEREDVEADLSGWAIRVAGKGGHVRVVPLPHDLADLILTRPPGFLFPSPGGGHLTPNHLGKLVSARLGRGLTTHSLRHRAATVAYAATHDLRAVQELLGHSKPETTAQYTAIPDRDVRAAMMAAAA